MLQLIVDNTPTAKECGERVTVALDTALDELQWAQQWLKHIDSGLVEPELLKAMDIIRNIKKEVSP